MHSLIATPRVNGASGHATSFSAERCGNGELLLHISPVYHGTDLYT